jgi:hypothetical protein
MRFSSIRYNDVVRETWHRSLSILAAQRRTGIWRFADASANVLDHPDETEPEGLTPPLVEPRRLDHLCSGTAVNIDCRHRNASRAR